MKVEINIDPMDFEMLWDNSMKWRENDWEKQIGRFDPKPSFLWKYAYWFDTYSALLLAQAFLKGKASGTYSDEVGGWVILTNYASPCHMRK